MNFFIITNCYCFPGGCFLTAAFHPLLGSGAVLEPCQHIATVLPLSLDQCKVMTCDHKDANAFNYYVPYKECNLKKCPSDGVLVITPHYTAQHVFGDLFENFVYINF